MKGQDKIPILIVEKSQELAKTLIPVIADMATNIGIENIELPNAILPDSCATSIRLNEFTKNRETLVSQLSQGAEIIKNLAKITVTLGVVVEITDTTLQTLNTTKTATTTVLQVTPSPTIPPPVVAGLSNLQTLINKLGPKINTTKNILRTTNTAVGIAELVLYSLIKILKVIDEYLTKCGVTDLAPYSDYLKDIDNRISQQENSPLPLTQEYQGFTLEIVEEQYTPTVVRRRAVAKNKSNIVLLQTPLSFTTESQLLIEELKLTIDKNNLKAY